MFQIHLRVFWEPIPDKRSIRTYFLQSRSQDLLESTTKIVTVAVGETNTILKSEFLLLK